MGWSWYLGVRTEVEVEWKSVSKSSLRFVRSGGSVLDPNVR